MQAYALAPQNRQNSCALFPPTTLYLHEAMWCTQQVLVCFSPCSKWGWMWLSTRPTWWYHRVVTWALGPVYWWWIWERSPSPGTLGDSWKISVHFLRALWVRKREEGEKERGEEGKGRRERRERERREERGEREERRERREEEGGKGKERGEEGEKRKEEGKGEEGREERMKRVGEVKWWERRNLNVFINSLGWGPVGSFLRQLHSQTRRNAGSGR